MEPAAKEARPKMQLDEAHKRVLKALAQYWSMPFLELTTRVPEIDDAELEIIIKNLENNGMVSVANPDDIFEEIVTLKEKGIEAVA